MESLPRDFQPFYFSGNVIIHFMSNSKLTNSEGGGKHFNRVLLLPLRYENVSSSN